MPLVSDLVFESRDIASSALRYVLLGAAFGYQISGPGVPYLGITVESQAVRSHPRFRKLLRDLNLELWIDGNVQPQD
jgi:hypothetical protein